MAIVAQGDLELEQLDVKTSFLPGEFEERIYMKQPEGFVQEGQKNKVCLLKKSLYEWLVYNSALLYRIFLPIYE